MIIRGTCYFVSLAKAIKYYEQYEGKDAADVVAQKIQELDIVVGVLPLLKKGERVVKIDNGCRYAVVENTP